MSIELEIKQNLKQIIAKKKLIINESVISKGVKDLQSLTETTEQDVMAFIESVIITESIDWSDTKYWAKKIADLINKKKGE